MGKMTELAATGIVLMGLLSFWPERPAIAAPPLQNEASGKEEAQKEKEKEQEKEKKKTPEEEKKTKEEQELTKSISDVRKRQESDEKSVRVRANVFTSKSPEDDCTGADKARSRLDEVGDEGGVVIKGDLIIASSNEAKIEKNEGSITNETSINITNEINKRC